MILIHKEIGRLGVFLFYALLLLFFANPREVGHEILSRSSYKKKILFLSTVDLDFYGLTRGIPKAYNEKEYCNAHNALADT